jgi:hypothetical protein
MKKEREEKMKIKTYKERIKNERVVKNKRNGARTIK